MTDQTPTMLNRECRCGHFWSHHNDHFCRHYKCDCKGFEQAQPSPVSPAPQGDPPDPLALAADMVLDLASGAWAEREQADQGAADYLVEVIESVAAALRAARAEIDDLKAHQAKTTAAWYRAEDRLYREQKRLGQKIADYVSDLATARNRAEKAEVEAATFSAERDAALQRAEQAEQARAAIEAAVREVCPAEPSDAGEARYVCMGESGDPAIEADDIPSVIRQLMQRWDEAYAKLQAIEQAHQQLRAAAQYFADLTTCDEDRERCEADSGPCCQTHGDNSIHADEIAALRRALSPQEPT